MEKRLKRLLAIALSLMVMLTMGTSVFAAEPHAAAAPVKVNSAADLEDGTYLLFDITSSFKMFKVNQPATLIVDGEDATLIVESSSTAASRYDQIYMGHQDTVTEETEGIQGTVSDGVLRFEIPLKTSDVSLDEPMYFTLRYRAGYSEEHDGDWYMATNPAYFTLGAAKIQQIDLVPTNEEAMFKVVNAYVENTVEGPVFVFALNGSGYQNIIAGTYEEAMAVGKDKMQWIAGVRTPVNIDYWMDGEPPTHVTEGTKNKLQFRIPIAEYPETGTLRIPFVAISKSKAEEAEAANPDDPDYSSAFYARQALIDVDAETVRVGNFKDTFDVAVDNKIKGFNAAETATVFTVGSPAANEYTCQPTITMKDKVYDKAFKGSAAQAVEEGAEMIQPDSNNAFTFTFKNSLDKEPQIVDGVATVAFHNAKSGIWFDRTLSIDVVAKTMTISGVEDSSTAITNLKITGVKAKAGKKKITVSWKKNSKVDGYQVYYKKKGSKAKTVVISKNTTTKKVLKKLKKNKKYTVKVRGFKKFGATPVYTKWSVSKTAKVK